MLFDPPLGRWERRIGWAWIITGGTAAMALWLGVFGWWWVLIITIPLIYYALIAPGLFLYMSAVLIPLLLTRRRLRPLGWATAVMLVAALASWLPWQSARRAEAGLGAALAGERHERDSVGLPDLALHAHRLVELGEPRRQIDRTYPQTCGVDHGDGGHVAVEVGAGRDPESHGQRRGLADGQRRRRGRHREWVGGSAQRGGRGEPPGQEREEGGDENGNHAR